MGSICKWPTNTEASVNELMRLWKDAGYYSNKRVKTIDGIRYIDAYFYPTRDLHRIQHKTRHIHVYQTDGGFEFVMKSKGSSTGKVFHAFYSSLTTIKPPETYILEFMNMLQTKCYTRFGINSNIEALRENEVEFKVLLDAERAKYESGEDNEYLKLKEIFYNQRYLKQDIEVENIMNIQAIIDAIRKQLMKETDAATITKLQNELTNRAREQQELMAFLLSLNENNEKYDKRHDTRINAMHGGRTHKYNKRTKLTAKNRLRRHQY